MHHKVTIEVAVEGGWWTRELLLPIAPFVGLDIGYVGRVIGILTFGADEPEANQIVCTVEPCQQLQEAIRSGHVLAGWDVCEETRA